MDEKLIRVRDFAEACGCTPQNIYLHLKNYAAELEGHIFQGKGRQGQLLDEYAQEFLRSIMYPKEISADATVAKLQEEVEKLRSALFKASQKEKEMTIELTQVKGENQQLRFDNDSFQKRLKASREAEEEKNAQLADTQNQLAAVHVELSEAHDVIEMQERNLEIGNEARRQLMEELEAEKKQNQALKNRNWFQRLTRQGE